MRLDTLSVIEGLKIIRKNEINVIVSTCKPNSSAIIGALLSKITGIPLVLDFRDPWRKIIYKMAGNNSDSLSNLVPDWRDAIDKLIESSVLRHAKQLVFTTEETRALYEDVYSLLQGRTHTIYNGFADGYFHSSFPKAFENFTIVYSGNYYFELGPSESFFQALHILKDDTELRGNFRFLYIGDNSQIRRLHE